jgi:alanine racemase
MPILSIRQINIILEGELHSNEVGSEFQISSVSIDSRTIFDPESSLFFAIKTERNDGHRYIADLVHAGARSFVVSEYSDEMRRFESCSFIVVRNSLTALQKLAAWHRSQFKIPVVGITGSNGKTIVKEWLFDILKDRAVIRSPKSYNSQVGVPLSVWNLSSEYELAIFEAGISMPGEMQNLQEIIRPTVGILTNIGEAHQENFKSKNEKLEEKLKLFKTCDTLIYCKDQQLVHEEISKRNAGSEMKLVAWSFRDENAGIFFSCSENGDGTEIVAKFEGKDFHVGVPFQDSASLENAAHCLAFVLSQYFADVRVLELFGSLQPVAMRLEMKEGINNCLLINDYYNSDINSVQIALGFLNNQARQPYPGKTVILSDIQQAGIPDEQLYQEVARLLHLYKTNRLIGIGQGIRKFSGLFGINASFYDSTSQFLETIDASNFKQECILLKGARDFHFERISSVLQKKYHQTVLEIDLNAMVSNLNFFRSAIHPETKIMAMVKAFSYGSGMAEIARILQFHKVDYLAVAVADEGIELRQAGIDLPIVIMNPEEHSFENMIEFRLEPNIYSREIFESFRKVLQQHAVVRYPIHLKLDTGMHRLGFDSAEEVESLTESLLAQEEMVVRSVFSHLAGADEAVHDDYTQNQVQQFDKLSSLIVANLPYKVYRHILNSAGIERFPQYQFEMVRLGIGLYGISASGNIQVKCISRLKTSISQIRRISAGETVGYGRKGVVNGDAIIAVLPVGYADGYDRRLSNGVGKVYVKGTIVPVIGNVCMDMCMIDVSGMQVAVGDEVELMGEHILVSDMANSIGTIPYEVLTGISQRVKRVYLQE